MKYSEIPSNFKEEPLSDKVLQLKEFIEQELKGVIHYVFKNSILVDGGMYLIKYDRRINEFSIGFHVNCDPGDAAYISKTISLFLTNKGIKLVIRESIAFEFNENGIISSISTGKNAYDTVGRKRFYGDQIIFNHF